MRDFERMLVLINIAGSLLLGCSHDVALLAISVAVFAVYVILEDRAVRSRVGMRAWPSEGFADFALGTNIAFAIWNLALSALFFFVGNLAASAAGF